jgi:mono/diheme cytochrome c family protein
MSATIKRILQFVGALAVLAVLAAASGVAYGLSRWDKRTFDPPVPAIHATADPADIERGRYLAYGPARCVECHISRDEVDSVEAGAMPPLAGGLEFRTPVGTYYTPNITPDEHSGIGKRTDGELARTLRYGVRHDGRAMLPFMEVQGLSDDDVRALLSFLRSQPAVHRMVPAHEYNLAGKLVMAYLIKPVAGVNRPPVHSPPDSATVERGEYVAEAVATCAGCHTKRSHMDGSYTGPRFAGGEEFEVEGDPKTVFVTPNLTPAKAGRITSWTEEEFVARFRQGRLLPKSPMPWRSFSRMSETDLRAVYRYLRTVQPEEADPGPSVRASGEATQTRD